MTSGETGGYRASHFRERLLETITFIKVQSLGSRPFFGGLAHLGERLICIQEVIGSSPISSTKINMAT